MADHDTQAGESSVRPDPTPAGHSKTSSGPQSAKESAQHHARDAVDQAKNQMQSVLADQKQAAAGQLDGIVKALHATVEQLRKQDQAPAAEYVERAADGLNQFSSTLRERDIDSLGAQVRDFARRQPGVFLGGAVAAGFLVARFLKSSPASTSSSTRFSSSDEPYAGTSTDEPGANARYSQPGSPDATADSVSTST